MSIETEIKQDKFKSAHNKLVVNLMYTSNWLSNDQHRLLHPFGLTIQQYNVLRILRGRHPKPVHLTYIIERMLDKMSNASRLVDKLFQKGLVERIECATDRRAVDVVITKKGLNLLKTLDGKQDEWEKIVYGISAEEAEQLSALLDKVRG
ncbi:MAG: MarR family transcriptional regulator [Runella slithyformis]|nr:MAG: MarR family transcriptional regulator [Runella slithyformis]